MSEDAKRQRSETDAEIEREIRSGRKFTLGEAVGRAAGPGIMKGASPVTLKRQAQVQLDDFLRTLLTDSGSCLRPVLRRRVGDSDLLLANLEQPAVVLVAYLQRVLDSESLLKDLVRDADGEWGRLHGERPHFEKQDRPPHPDDPYTVDLVRAELSALVVKLTSRVR
jgi:hypothetical protein